MYPETRVPGLLLDRRQESWHIGMLAAAMALNSIIALLVQLLVGSLFHLWLPAVENTVLYAWALGSLPIYLAGDPATYGLLRGLPRRVPERRRLNVLQLLGALAVLVSSSIVGSWLCEIFCALFPGLPGDVTDSSINSLATEAPLWVLLLFSVVLAPLFEEWVSRKLLLDRLTRYGTIPAMLVSGVTFALFHGNLTQAFTALPAGILLAFVYLYTGRMSYTVGLHAAFNLLCGVFPTVVMRAGKWWGTHYALVYISAMLLFLRFLATLPVLVALAKDLKRGDEELPCAIGRMPARDWVRATLGNVGVWFYLAAMVLLFAS